jgi:hypothetical protein
MALSKPRQAANGFLATGTPHKEIKNRLKLF